MPPPTTTTGITPPAATQSGIAANCNKYAIPVDGDGCWDFATRNGITLDQLCKSTSLL